MDILAAHLENFNTATRRPLLSPLCLSVPAACMNYLRIIDIYYLPELALHLNSSFFDARHGHLHKTTFKYICIKSAHVSQYMPVSRSDLVASGQR